MDIPILILIMAIFEFFMQQLSNTDLLGWLYLLAPALFSVANFLETILLLLSLIPIRQYSNRTMYSVPTAYSHSVAK